MSGAGACGAAALRRNGAGRREAQWDGAKPSVLSRELYHRLSGNTRSLVQFMQSSPLYGMDDVVFERDKSVAREVSL